MTKATSTPVAIVVPQNAQSLDISGPLDAFLEANRQAPGKCNYEVRLLSTSWDRNVTAGGMSLMAHGSIFDDDGPIDTLLVAGTPDYAQAYKEPATCTLLRRHALRSRRYGSDGTGAFFLGAAGLLDGLNVTTHWQHTSELAEKFPAAKVSPDRIFVQDGALCTSAGVAAGIDLALKLIEDDHGYSLALSVARRLVVFLKRSGGQSQVSAHLAAQGAKEGRIHAVQHWILEHLQLELTVKTLALRTAMSVRNFTRVFQEEAGVTPGNFVEMARVDRARRLLEDTNRPLKCVATLCGFANRDTMRRAFMRRIGTGPNEHRDRFRRQDSVGLPGKPPLKPPPAKAFHPMSSPDSTPPGLLAAHDGGRVRDHHAS
ncbi:GlxA family transcriptional regulator [Bradyrhizobium sp. 6(2017)]|uniref:GlxA family transcriptional regulator n=1 Tax=Bradyrhizobium sp. 6(2017) TaxID=1197460 RepID=UPI0013E1F6F2|nr:helix-turn-helix domain-containing protein [Bradyrhizobium sp. 6(2017)]QIG98206.1 helix-turn-helix domain-containing protein [Bradyrhizobium sp. 6(2017)]